MFTTKWAVNVTKDIIHTRQLSYYWKFRDWYARLIPPRPGKPPYSHIVQIGDPRLRVPCENVNLTEINTPHMKAVLSQMKLVFKKYDCVGLAAPQIGVNLRIFIMEFSKRHVKQCKEKEIVIKEISEVPLSVCVSQAYPNFM